MNEISFQKVLLTPVGYLQYVVNSWPSLYREIILFKCAPIGSESLAHLNDCSFTYASERQANQSHRKILIVV
jgi:hypothetical protein